MVVVGGKGVVVIGTSVTSPVRREEFCKSDGFGCCWIRFAGNMICNNGDEEGVGGGGGNGGLVSTAEIDGVTDFKLGSCSGGVGGCDGVVSIISGGGGGGSSTIGGNSSIVCKQ